MALLNIAVPSLVINNQTILVLPETVEIDLGTGTQKVRSLSAGGRSVETVHSVNAETMIGKVNFDLSSTDLAITYEPIWRSRMAQNTIVLAQINDDGTKVSIAFENMSLADETMYELNSEGKGSFNFQGNPAFIQ